MLALRLLVIAVDAFELPSAVSSKYCGEMMNQSSFKRYGL